MKRTSLALSMALASFGLYAGENPVEETTSSYVLASADPETTATAEVLPEAAEKKSQLKEKLLHVLGIGEDEPVAEEEKAFPLGMTVDLVSRYIWRGSDYGNSPSIQPGLYYTAGKKDVTFTLGYWGDYAMTARAASAVNPNAYMENDFYSTLAYKYLYVMFTDYYTNVSGEGNYFKYRFPKGASHVYEMTYGYSGTDKFPMTIYVAHNVGGAIDYDGDGEKDLNGVYVDLSYPVYEGISLILGMASGPVYYLVGDKKFNVVTAGITAGTELNLGKHIKMPVSGSLLLNPDQKTFRFVAKIGLSN